MAPSKKEPTRAQLSSRLAYSQSTPLFLQKMKNRVAGIPDEEDEEEEEEWENLGGDGRVPIPRRPKEPEADEDEDAPERDEEGEEKPQIVVLREGKHLSEDQVRRGTSLILE